MRKLRVYIETTLFNYYFDVERDAHLATISFFKEIEQTLKWEAYTSDYVILELLNADPIKSQKMLELINLYNITVLTKNESIAFLADEYRKYGILPNSSILDSLHLACATHYNMDMVISLNFRHIVRSKTLELMHLYNATKGLYKPNIYAPMEVIDYEENI